MYRFLLRPRWLAFTLGVVVLVIVLANLGLWQLRRLDERQAFNQRVEERTELPAAAVDEVLPVAASESEVDAAEWRTVTAAGTYDGAGQVLIRNRSLDGAPGYHVVTPLDTAGGTLLVNRGWIPFGDGAEVTDVPPPPGEVEVTGRVRETQERGRFGAADPAGGTLTELARVDVERIAAQTAGAVYPVYVELTDVGPGDPVEGGPVPLPAPERDEGPHLSYAGQWFLFGACAIAGWIVVVRRAARQGGRVRRPGTDAKDHPGDQIPVA